MYAKKRRFFCRGHHIEVHLVELPAVGDVRTVSATGRCRSAGEGYGGVGAATMDMWCHVENMTPRVEILWGETWLFREASNACLASVLDGEHFYLHVDCAANTGPVSLYVRRFC